MAHKSIAPVVPDTFLGKLQNGKSVHEFRNKQRICSQGDSADAVFYLQRGKVKMTVVSQRGKEAVIGIVEPGQFFGESSLVAGHPLRISSTTSVGHSTVIRYDKEAVVRLLHEDAEFADRFVSYTLARTVRVEEDFSIRPRSGSRGFSCSSPTSVKMAHLSPSFQGSARRLWRKWLA